MVGQIRQDRAAHRIDAASPALCRNVGTRGRADRVNVLSVTEWCASVFGAVLLFARTGALPQTPGYFWPEETVRCGLPHLPFEEMTMDLMNVSYDTQIPDKVGLSPGTKVVRASGRWKSSYEKWGD